MTSNTITPDNIDQSKVQEFMMKAVGDIASNMSAMTVILGERLGLYKAMADLKPVTSAELAAKTNTYERYIREWLASQAAAGYVKYKSFRRQILSSSGKCICIGRGEQSGVYSGCIPIITLHIQR